MFGIVNLVSGLDGFLSLGRIDVIELKLNIPFFMVDIVLDDNMEPEAKIGQLIFVHKPSDLIKLNEIKGVDIKTMYIVSPSYLNNIGDWRQEKIKEMSFDKPNTDDLPKIYEFRTINGEFYLFDEHFEYYLSNKSKGFIPYLTF